MSLKIAVDVGHGFTKGLSESGKRVLFPSLIALAPSGPDLGDFAGSAPIVVNDHTYLIGESARLSASSLFSREKSTDSLTLALTWSAVAQLTGPGYHTVEIAVGLPLSWYAVQKTTLAAALRGTVDVDYCRLLIESVTVFPQGIGALLAIDTLPDGLIGLVDVGYRTVDYLVAQVQGGVPRPILDRSGTWQNGMHVAYTAMSQRLEKQTTIRFEPHELVERESVMASGQRVQLEPYRAVALQALAGELSRHLATSWDGIAEKLDALFLAGGGALALQPYLEFPGQQILPDSQWANAQGYLGLLG